MDEFEKAVKEILGRVGPDKDIDELSNISYAVKQLSEAYLRYQEARREQVYLNNFCQRGGKAGMQP